MIRERFRCVIAFVLSRCMSWYRQRSSRAALSSFETIRNPVERVSRERQHPRHCAPRVSKPVSKYTPWLKCTSHFNCPNIDHPMEECNGSPLVISVKRVRGRAGHKASALMVMMLLFIDPHFISCRVSGKRFSLGKMDT